MLASLLTIALTVDSFSQQYTFQATAQANI
jgi:hypothetical protein